MNKEEFIKELMTQTQYSKKDCIIINDILEKNFFISKKNKNIIVNEIQKELNISNKLATNIYEKAINIIINEIKYKLKHPFKSQNIKK